MSDIVSREIRLASRPVGWPTEDNFELAAVGLPAPGPGQVRVENLFLSVDPYMRGRMKDVRSYVPPFEIGEPLEGGAVGRVTVSNADGVDEGAIVVSSFGWREAFVADAEQVRVVDPAVRPLSSYLGVLGVTGMTAWVGLRLVDIAPGEVVWVSAAAGAVGSIAGQLARQRGCRVVGSAGSAEKVAWLRHELGFDAAFDYHDGPVDELLAAAAPDGVDVYFDNVGGDHLEAALGALRNNGRIIACGAISLYNREEPEPGPRNMPMVVVKRLTMKGFIVSDWFDRMPEFVREVAPLVADGTLVARETVVEGIERAPAAFIDLLRGGNLGKMVVKVG